MYKFFETLDTCKGKFIGKIQKMDFIVYKICDTYKKKA